MIKNEIKSFISGTINFVFPKSCIISDNKIPKGNSNPYILDREFEKLEKITGEDLQELRIKVSSENAFSHYAYRNGSSFQKIIHHLKYNRMKRLGIFLGRGLGMEMLKRGTAVKGKYSVMLPVPLHRVRLRERGYNHSEYICMGLNDILMSELKPGYLKRVKNTKSQTYLTKKQRKENVKGAFKINEKYEEELEGKDILLVDDVVTTGATVNEAIKILKESGCGKILTISCAMARD